MSTRLPAVAGTFYPADAGALREAVTEYLDAAEPAPAAGTVRGILCPHAGYLYSGHTAAYAFKRAQGKAPKRIVLIGRSHHYLFEGISVWPSGGLGCPLGVSPVDVAFTEALCAGLPVASPRMHDKEHALEVMLPFIHIVFGGVPVVAILFGSEPSRFAEEVGARIASLLEADDLVLLSTDLSHYLGERAANNIDTRSIEAVLSGDPTRFARRAAAEEISLCGATAVEAGLACMDAIGAQSRFLLDYRTSAWASGDTQRVVGYAAMSFESPAS